MQSIIGILFAAIALMLFTQREASNEVVILEEKKNTNYVKELTEVVDMIIDPKIGYTSRKNSSCSNLGYWNDITVYRVMKCTGNNNYKYKFTGDETSDDDKKNASKSYFYWGQEHQTTGDVKVYLSESSTDDKRFELLVDASSLPTDDKILLANKFASLVTNKYKMHIADVQTEATGLTTNGGDINDGFVRIIFEI